ncbi:MAG: EutN/CcmL family microcompartment protein [Kiritimatiellia bacterium]
MIAGRVTGHIYSTINHPFYDGKRMLVVEKIDETGKALNDYVIAVDTVDAGPGDKVLIVDEGNGARQILQSSDGPVRSVIVGIIDEISI